MNDPGQSLPPGEMSAVPEMSGPPPIILEGGSAAPAPEEGPATPWGFWPTLGLSTVIGLGHVAVQVAVVLAFVVKGTPRDGLETNGLLLALATIASTPVTVGLALFFASLRRGLTVREYLGLHWPGWGSFLRWGVGVVVLLVAGETVMSWLGQSTVPEVMLQIYSSAGFLPLLWLALVVGAPLGEEILMRGFLFTGLSRSRLGPVGTIFATSVLWSLIHTQYDIYGIAQIFLLGLFLGVVRWVTGSLYLCMALHAFVNGVATVQMMFVMAG